MQKLTKKYSGVFEKPDKPVVCDITHHIELLDLI